MNPFQKAKKSASKLRLGLIGPAGSGKTWTALTVACALGGKVAVIDTEKGSASKYASDFDFDVLELADFAPARYVESIRAAVEAGYSVVVIDSLSHAWTGKGGALEMHDAAVARQKTKNSFTAWGEVTPHHNALIEAMVQSSIHVIATMRSKTEYVQEKDQNGRTTIRKIGLAPVQRDGMEYEFDLVGDLDTEHTLVVTKSRCSALADAVVKKPGINLAKQLLAWLTDGAPMPARAAESAPANGTSELPATAKLFVAMVKKDQALTKAGLCGKGELLNHLSRLGAQSEFGPKLETWQGPKATVFAADAIKRFEEFAKQSCSLAQQKEIDALFNKLEMSAEDCEGFLSEYGVALGEIPTERKARSIIDELKKLMAAEKVPVRQPGDELDEEIPY